MRLVAVQHLRTAHGIKIKNWNKNKASGCKATANNSVSLDRASCRCNARLTRVSSAATLKLHAPCFDRAGINEGTGLLFSLLNQISILPKARPHR